LSHYVIPIVHEGNRIMEKETKCRAGTQWLMIGWRQICIQAWGWL